MEGKRVGRPPKSAKGSATANLTMRLRPEVYDELRRAADANGRSISAQAETRLQQPELHEIGRIVSLAIDGVEGRAGKSWRDDADVRVRARVAAEAVLNLVLGPAISEAQLREKLIDELNRADRFAAGNPSAFDLMLELKPKTVEEMRRGVDLLGAIEADNAAIHAIEPLVDISK